jgi:hypothetical protein
MMLLVELVEDLLLTFSEWLSLVCVVHTHPPSELNPSQQTDPADQILIAHNAVHHSIGGNAKCSFPILLKMSSACSSLH